MSDELVEAMARASYLATMPEGFDGWKLLPKDQHHLWVKGIEAALAAGRDAGFELVPTDGQPRTAPSDHTRAVIADWFDFRYGFDDPVAEADHLLTALGAEGLEIFQPEGCETWTVCVQHRAFTESGNDTCDWVTDDEPPCDVGLYHLVPAADHTEGET